MRHSSLLMLALMLGGLVLIFLSAWRMSASQEAVERGLETLKECRQLADQIDQLRGRNARATLQETPEEELSALVEQAAQAAAIRLERIVRIDPAPPQRVGETDYRQQATRIELQETSVPELCQFLTTILEVRPNLTLPSLRLSAPRTTDSSIDTSVERWQIELVLTQFIYAPTTGAAR